MIIGFIHTAGGGGGGGGGGGAVGTRASHTEQSSISGEYHY